MCEAGGGGDCEARDAGGSCCRSGLLYLYGGGWSGEEERRLILKSRGASGSRGTGGPGYEGGDTGGLAASVVMDLGRGGGLIYTVIKFATVIDISAIISARATHSDVCRPSFCVRTVSAMAR
jgi:hypothetical protein